MTIRAPNGAGLDLHELLLTSQGDAYFIIDENRQGESDALRRCGRRGICRPSDRGREPADW